MDGQIERFRHTYTLNCRVATLLSNMYKFWHNLGSQKSPVHEIIFNQEYDKKYALSWPLGQKKTFLFNGFQLGR